MHNLPSDPIHHYFWGGYWDGPLNGWLYARGRFYYYELLNEPGQYYRLYKVYFVPKEIRVPHLLRHRSFCHHVGWHCNRKPGESKRWFSSAAKPDYQQWFKIEWPGLPEIPKTLLVGVTTLHDGNMCWFNEPEEFSRDWKYIEDDYDDEEENND